MPKANAYFFYMLDFKREKERGTKLHLNMKDVSEMASSSWNSMSDDKKAYYKEKAKNENQISQNKVGRLTSQGLPVSLYDKEERERKNEEENMHRRVGLMVKITPPFTDFVSRPIYLMYGNFFYKNHDRQYAPAELAMLKFTFRDGISKRFHTYINPGKVELGFAYTAKAHSNANHRLPPPPKAFGFNNMDSVLCEINEFMKDDAKSLDGGAPIVFAYANPYASEDNQLDVLKSFMQQFAQDGDNSGGIAIYPLTRLFYALRKELTACGRCDEVPNEDFCNVFLSRDPYETIAGISCQYHETIDATRHCALSRVYRWSYLLADHFCEPLGVELIPGTHLPKGASLPFSMASCGSECDAESLGVDQLAITIEANDNSKGNGKPSRGFTSNSEVKSMDGASRNKHEVSSIAPVSKPLDDGIQSVRAASTATNGPNRGRKRPSRASMISFRPFLLQTPGTLYGEMKPVDVANRNKHEVSSTVPVSKPLDDGIQSVRAASTATNGHNRGKVRPSRVLMIPDRYTQLQNSSTFYNS